MTSVDPTYQTWFDRARAHPVEGILEKRGFKLPSGTKNERKGPCPVCGGDDRFGLNVTKQIFTCHQCSLKGAGGIDITMALDSCDARTAAETLEGPPPKSNGHDTGTDKWSKEGEWVYQDQDGKPYLKVVRYRKPDGEKVYPQYHWDGAQWVKKKPDGAKIPYRLPELLDADRTEPVFLVEGEKCADRLAKEGVAVTTASEGASKWTADLNQHFADRIVWILPDTDEPGRKHARQVAANLHGIAREVRIVEISGLNEGQDVFDFLEGGGTGNDLRDLGERVPLWQPPPNGEGISQGPDGTVGEKPDRPEALPEIEVSDAGNDPEPEKLPPRGWLMGLMFCRQFLSGIMAEGGTGKTSLRILQFISMAIGRALTGHHVFMRCRVLIVSLEDSKPELQRRIAAARIHHSVSKEQVKGWLYYVTLEDLKGMKLATAGPNGPQRGQLAEALSVIIDKLEIDVVCIDPTIKAHELNENLNKDMDYICDILTNDLAIQRDMAVDLSMHQRKGSKDPGDADSGRGASSVRDAGRLIYTLTTMSEDEAKLFNISEVDRKAYVRLDPAKVNIAPSAQKATWYKLVGVKLGNKTETYPNGDEVQTVELWSPPDTWANLSTAALNEALTEIDAGLSNGQRFSSASAAKDRAAWPVVQRHCPDRAEGQCRDIVNTWVRTGLLLNQDYEDPISRKTVKGLYVDNTKRPT